MSPKGGVECVHCRENNNSTTNCVRCNYCERRGHAWKECPIRLHLSLLRKGGTPTRKRTTNEVCPVRISAPAVRLAATVQREGRFALVIAFFLSILSFKGHFARECTEVLAHQPNPGVNLVKSEVWAVTRTQPRAEPEILLASCALSIKAASASSCASQRELPFHHRSLMQDEVKIVSDSPELNSSTLSSTHRITALHGLEGNDFLCPTTREFMQLLTTKTYECKAFIDNECRPLSHASVERMQDALIESFESPSKSTRATLERSAEGKGMVKPPEEWGSVPFKLTVPLRVVSLRASLPPIWLKDFLVRFSVEYQNSLNEIISALQSAVKKKEVKPKSILAADLVTVGDSWLSLAVSGGLIQPIENAKQQEWFKRLNTKWEAFARRDFNGDLNPKGVIWGVPYRWGSMVIAYKKDQFLKNNIPPLEDWQDLWKPELEGQIAMVDSPREVVGAVLKSLKASYNAQNFDCDVRGGREAVKQQFLALEKQVKVFDSVHHVKVFGSDDVWVAVGWSSDVIPVAKRMSNVRVVTPKSGVSLWVDFWAIPAANSVSTKKIGSRVHAASPLIHQWFDFCLQPAPQQAQPVTERRKYTRPPLRVLACLICGKESHFIRDCNEPPVNQINNSSRKKPPGVNLVLPEVEVVTSSKVQEVAEKATTPPAKFWKKLDQEAA
ncbi:hypothetical protein L7F22_044948 [Adiantum nelumboides]|nr:hypothetical protein [Adiantum nelumboides]